MPLYEFHCRSCSSDFELLVRGNELLRCPECDSSKLEKLLSAPAAPMRAKSDLPTCHPVPAGGCGLPQCGLGGCGM